MNMDNQFFTLEFLYKKLLKDNTPSQHSCLFAHEIYKAVNSIYCYPCNRCFFHNGRKCLYHDPELLIRDSKGVYKFEIKGYKEKFLKQLVKDFPNLLLEEE